MKPRALRRPVQLGLSPPRMRRRRKRPAFEDFKRFVRLLELSIAIFFAGPFPGVRLTTGWFNSRRFVAESRPRTPTTDPADTKRRAKMLLSVNQISELTGRDRHGIPGVM